MHEETCHMKVSFKPWPILDAYNSSSMYYVHQFLANNEKGLIIK